MTEIVKMDFSHIPDVAQIERECFSTPWSEKSLAEEVDNPVSHFFVCLENGEAVGYAGIHIVCREGYVDNIAVKLSHRRQKIGTALLEKLTETALNEKSEFISLEVRESNRGAISMYEKAGFENAGIRKNFYDKPQENAVIMTKRLAYDGLKTEEI